MPTPPGESFTSTVRAGLERACRDFTARVEPRGFHRTLKMFWTRRHLLTVDFIHFHRGGSSYGAPRTASVDIHVHFGIRVLNDDFVAAAFNGPQSDAVAIRAGRYHLRFNAETGSTYERCVDDLARFVIEQGEPWFQRWNSIDALLQSDSPLRPQERDSLRAARAGQASAERVAASLKILGIKET
ncbi:MAG TPA: hypothetical protein VMZ27_15635 [Candidatus Saccharimonadales bacterium]|nr:hypothetical protein [Candidatus Saccharimonadales bacterium]